MTTPSSLSLKEQFILLALHDEKGTLETSTGYLHLGLAACLLLELAECDAVTLEGRTLIPATQPSLADELCRKLWEEIRTENQYHTVQRWLTRMTQRGKGYRDAIIDRLIEKQVLKREETRLLWVFSRTVYPMIDGGPEHHIRQQIREVLLFGGSPSPQVHSLALLLESCQLMREVFPIAGERRVALAAIKHLKENNPLAHALDRYFEQMHTAVIHATHNLVLSTSAPSDL